MALLPRYQRIGITNRPMQRLDFTEEKEAVRLAENVRTQLDKMTDFQLTKMEEQAVVRGQERVRSEGALPTLEAIQAKGGPKTIAEKSAVDAANRIAVVEIESLAKQDMQNLVRQADKSGMSTSAFNASMADIRDGYTASMSVVDPVAAGILTARLNDSSMTYEGKYADIAVKKATAATKKRVTEIVTFGSQEILDSATQPGATGETIGQAATKLYQTQLELGVKEENAQKVVDGVLKKALRENRLYLYDNAADISTKKALLKEFEKSELPGHTYEQNRSFNSSLESSLNAEISRAQSEAINGLNDAVNVITNTGAPPEGFEIDSESIDSIFSPEEAAEFKDVWADATEDAANRGALNFMSPKRVDQITEELTTEINTAENPERAIARSRAWNNAVADRNDALNKDAGLYAVQTDPIAQGVVETIQRHMASGNVGMLAESLIILRELNNTKYEVMGVPTNKRNVMPKALASQMVAVIKSVETDVAAVTLNDLKTRLGGYAPQFIEELRSQDLPPEYVQAMYANKPGVQQELLQISDRDIKEIKVGIDNTVQNDLRLAMTSALGDYRMAYLAGGGKVAEGIFNEQFAVMEKLALTRIKESGISPAQAAESVIADIVPESAQVVLTSKGKYVVSMGYNANTIENSASNFLDEDVLKLLDLEPLDSTLDPDFVDEAISIAAIATNGMWLNNSTGDGLILHYVINDVEIPVLTKDGKQFEVKFATMESQITELLKQTDAPMSQSPFGEDVTGSRP
jgi:hypothetical protein